MPNRSRSDRPEPEHGAFLWNCLAAHLVWRGLGGALLGAYTPPGANPPVGLLKADIQSSQKENAGRGLRFNVVQSNAC